MAPRVSVVILSHRPGVLTDAMNSVVTQTFRDREMIVKFAEEYWPTKLNDAVRAASGEFVCLLCDDDMLAPTYVARTVAEIDRTGADIAYTDNDVFGIMPMKLGMPEFSRDEVYRNCVPYVTALFRRSLWERVGGFDGDQPYIDWDFWIRCAEAGATAVHLAGEYLYRQRVDGNNATRVMDHGAALARLKTKHPQVEAVTARQRVA